MVWCLEDAIKHSDVPMAEANIVETLKRIAAADAQADPQVSTSQQAAIGSDALPLLFVRVRSAEQIRRIAAAAGPAINVLTGFSLPKATRQSVWAMLTAIREVNTNLSRPLYGMPILETPDIAWNETRRDSLGNLAEAFDTFADIVLCIRVGGTDISGLFGLRRDADTTVWDVGVVRDALVDVINQFARNGQHIVTGAVWEHISGPRMFKPQLRQSPFAKGRETGLRQQMIAEDVDGLMREITLDRVNGMHGKTVIHPSHVSVVNSMLAVFREEYDDALAILTAREDGGVIASAHGRMNEMGPHALWAEMITRRAAIYGVLDDQAALVHLLAAGQHAYAAVYEPNRDTQESVVLA
jgi:citrate lyase beta subunit